MTSTNAVRQVALSGVDGREGPSPDKTISRVVLRNLHQRVHDQHADGLSADWVALSQKLAALSSAASPGTL